MPKQTRGKILVAIKDLEMNLASPSKIFGPSIRKSWAKKKANLEKKLKLL